jgi:hypothetical protein
LHGFRPVVPRDGPPDAAPASRTAAAPSCVMRIPAPVSSTARGSLSAAGTRTDRPAATGGKLGGRPEAGNRTRCGWRRTCELLPHSPESGLIAEVRTGWRPCPRRPQRAPTVPSRARGPVAMPIGPSPSVCHPVRGKGPLTPGTCEQAGVWFQSGGVDCPLARRRPAGGRFSTHTGAGERSSYSVTPRTQIQDASKPVAVPRQSRLHTVTA